MKLFASLVLLTTAVAQVHQHGDMAGSVTDSSAIVWTRASTSALVSVLWSTDPGLAGAVETPPVIAVPGSDFTAKIPLSGLSPHTHYYYATRFRNLGLMITATGPIGTFRTAPAATATPVVRFTLGGDIRDQQPFDMLPRMAAHGADFYVSLGDMPYADGAASVADYWTKHKQVRDDPSLWAFFRSQALLATWDDHEVRNDWDARTDPVLVANGIEAWRQYFPIPPGSREIYHAFRWGDSVEVFVLDTRSHRASNAAIDTPAKSMLGATQLAWLEQSLSASTALFKIIATSVPLRYGTTGSDHWQGYVHERTRLLDYIDDHAIPNVVFVSADQHWGASYTHFEGFHEFQVGPVATTLRTPPYPEPESRWIGLQRNYGLMTIDPSVNPATLTMEWFGSGGLLRREVVAAAQPASMLVLTDATDGGFELTGGAFYLQSRGTDVALPRVPSDDYDVTFYPVDRADGTPAMLPVTVPPGAIVCAAGDYRDVENPAHPVLSAHDFEGPLTGFLIVDEGTTSAPSNWFTNRGHCQQTSNIFTDTSVAFPGTHAVTGDLSWTDYSTRVRMQSADNDGLGVIVRYSGNDDYYRFSMDSQRTYRRLVSKRNGVFRTLAQDSVAYQRGRWYDVDVIAIGGRIRVLIDGALVFDVTDNDHAAGAVGLYVWGNQPTAFDHLIVRSGDTTAIPPTPASSRPSFASIVAGQRLTLVGRAPGHAGLRYSLAMAGGRSPGIPLSLIQAGDSRTIELEPDGLFWATLQPSLFFAGFHGTVGQLGELSASVDWPVIPILSGLRLHVGGWVWRVDGTVGALIPTVDTRYP